MVLEAKTKLRKELKERLARPRPTPSALPVLASWLQKQKGLWASYKAVGHEVNLDQLESLCPHLQFAYPRIEQESLAFYLAKDFTPAGPLKISEPLPEKSQKVSLADLNGVLMPGLGFDQRGFRLGRGKGHYDRALENYKGIKVGVAWSDQVVEELPVDQHDVAMDYIASELGMKEV